MLARQTDTMRWFTCHKTALVSMRNIVRCLKILNTLMQTA